MKYLIIFITLVFNQVIAKTFTFDDYEAAQESQNYVKFESESTKFGLLTTSFDGHAKKFTINYNIVDSIVSDIKVNIYASSFDTNNSARDSKMMESILEVQKFPKVTFRSSEIISISKVNQSLSGYIEIKGERFAVNLNIAIKKENKKIFISGRTSLSLKEMGIPDPSIMIAKVRDTFDISFGIVIDE